MTTLMFVWMDEFHVGWFWWGIVFFFCWLSWPLNRVMHSGGTKLTYLLMVAIC